jgi:DNA invertase Pin-like site-specific DNA recombinase
MNALYLRVSSDKQSSEMQSREISLFLESKGLKIDLEFKDEGFSGGSDNRPGLNALKKAVKASQLKVIIVYRVDRLCRSLKHLLSLLELFDQYGVKLISVNDPIDLTNPNGIFQMQVMGAVAQLEKSIISGRVKAGLANAKAKGKTLGRPQKHGLMAKNKILSLYSEGLTIKEIRNQTGINVATIHKFIKEERKEKFKVLNSNAE